MKERAAVFQSVDSWEIVDEAVGFAALQHSIYGIRVHSVCRAGMSRSDLGCDWHAYIVVQGRVVPVAAS